MAISRLQASLAQATNEVTVAAANINFDFTLVKCEAPKEYHDLGNALSKRRKDEAESGQSHITARRLGALFEGTCPATPNLIKAYGLRASEIAAYATEHFAEPSESIFAEQNGIDGTSIWAAATSSPAAIHVQLLACMLARIWKAQYATSVWYELVNDRRQEIAGKYEDGETLRFATLAAAGQASISRSNLAEWDASARAWLRTADRVKSRAQRQLMLIVDNMNIPVSSDMAVYSSVMAAWKSALESMEKLVRGMPQATNIGPPLLALSSWHLYPNLLAIGEKEVPVKFDDPLISPGGHLTIGLATEDGDGRGVHWSLSLAHLNFYGFPVVSEGQFNVTSERLTFDQFVLAIFGSIMGAWGLATSSTNEVAELFTAVEDSLARAIQCDSQDVIATEAATKFFQRRSHWWRILSSAARSVLEATGADRDEVQKLVNLGHRRSSKIFPNQEESREPFFGLGDPSRLIGLMKGSPERIAFLRSMVEQRYSLDRPPGAATSLCIRIQGQPDVQSYCVTAFPLDGTSQNHRWLSHQEQQVQGESWPFIAGVRNIPSRSHCFTDANTGITHTHQAIYGDVKTAAICQDPSMEDQFMPPPTLETLIWCFKNDCLSALSLLDYLDQGLEQRDFLNATMLALSAAFTLFKSIPSATLNVKALDRPLGHTAWASALLTKRTKLNLHHDGFKMQMDRPEAFSCIAYMEACIDISPGFLDSVFALAHEDSLYIATQLVCDPSDKPASFELRRVLGNVGRPGITLLIPPTTQKVRPVDPSSWRVASTTHFNSLPENHFASTSLHLSFTEYYVAVHLEGQQNQDSQIFYLESYVSIYDSGKWVGDIDILKALSSKFLFPTRTECSHAPGNTSRLKISQEVVSVESWHDILDPPVETFVVRAHGNWVARLAVSAMLLQTLPHLGEPRKRIVSICPPGYCWECHTMLIAIYGAYIY